MSLPFIFTGPGKNHPNTMGIITTRISNQPPISAIEPSKLQLEDEKNQLKKMVADLTLDKAMLQDVLSKKL